MPATRPPEGEVEQREPAAVQSRVARWAVRAVSAAAGMGGLAWGYDFGNRVDGTFMGVVAGVNMAVIGALLAGAAAEWVVRRLPARHPRG